VALAPVPLREEGDLVALHGSSSGKLRAA